MLISSQHNAPYTFIALLIEKQASALHLSTGDGVIALELGRGKHEGSLQILLPEKEHWSNLRNSALRTAEPFPVHLGAFYDLPDAQKQPS